MGDIPPGGGRALPGPPAIQTHGLTKRYGDVAALTDLDLTVPSGMIYGFLGPNGAGKTTTIRILLGFVRASAGQARLQGHDVWSDGVAARRDLGYLVAPDALYPDMTGRAQLDYAAGLSQRPPVLRDRFLDGLELSRTVLGQRLGTYSKGMRQKLALVAACQHDPALLILDEPTDGLDPLVQRAFQGLLQELRDRGRTVFMSSHDLAEVERTCERVAVVRGGRLIAEGTVAEMTRFRRTAEVVFAGEVPAGLDEVARVTVLDREGCRARLAVDGDVNPLLRYLVDHPVADLVLGPPRLEDVFMAFYDRDTPDPPLPGTIGPGTNGRASVESETSVRQQTTAVRARLRRR
jgi:ABC-2 type transport system ATP-binding protein